MREDTVDCRALGRVGKGIGQRQRHDRPDPVRGDQLGPGVCGCLRRIGFGDGRRPRLGDPRAAPGGGSLGTFGQRGIIGGAMRQCGRAAGVQRLFKRLPVLEMPRQILRRDLADMADA